MCIRVCSSKRVYVSVCAVYANMRVLTHVQIHSLESIYTCMENHMNASTHPHKTIHLHMPRSAAPLAAWPTSNLFPVLHLVTILLIMQYFLTKYHQISNQNTSSTSSPIYSPPCNNNEQRMSSNYKMADE